MSRSSQRPVVSKRCGRCGQRCRRTRDQGWNVIFKQGIPVGLLCPLCQTPEENAEAEINDATTDYVGLDAFGRLVGRTKGVA